MYSLTHRIFSGSKLVQYKLYNLLTKQYEIKSIPETVDLTQQGLVQNLRYSSHRLQGKGISLSSIPRIQQNILVKGNINIKVYGNQEILLEYRNYSKYNKRNQFDSLYRSVKQSSKIVALYGLRRTGKTVLLIQLAQKLISEGNNICYILISKGAEARDLFNTLDKIKSKYDYIIIDEITYLDGFVCWANQLEMYNNSETKLVIAGTQSFALYMSKNDILLDRIDFIDTTYISFKEYNRLFNGTTLTDYIQNGGVLNRSYLSKELKTYIDSSIIENIIDTLATISETSYYPLRYLPFDRGTISSILNQIIYNSINYGAFSKYITFKDKNLTSALQLLRSKLSIRDTTIQILRDYVAYSLRIGDLSKRGKDITDDIVTYFINALCDLHFIQFKQICRIGKEVDYIYEIGFNQPGIRYNQSLKTINSIYQYRAQLKLSTEQFEQLRMKLIQDITDRILKEIITLNLMRLYGKGNVFQIQSLNTSGEIDVAVQTKHGLMLYEVKLSNNQVDNQARWLVNEKFMRFIEDKLITRVLERTVIYTGKTIDVTINNNLIHYINVTEFLLSI